MPILEHPKNILLVEDDDATRTALRDVLVNAGLTILEAKDGAAGLAVAIEAHPDLVLLDILMPKMDGWEVLKQVRTEGDWGKCVPVVILTNLSADEDVQIKHIAELGPSFFMVKADWKVEGIADKVLEMLNGPKISCS